MATIADLELQVKKLKKQMKQHRGRDNAAEVSDLVGKSGDTHMNPTRTGFANAVSQADHSSAASNRGEGGELSCSQPSRGRTVRNRR
jgi:hypothetical protein